MGFFKYSKTCCETKFLIQPQAGVKKNESAIFMYISFNRIVVIIREGLISLFTLFITYIFLSIFRLVIYGIFSLPVLLLLFLFFKDNTACIITAYSLFVVGLFIGRRAFIGFDI